MQTTKTTGEVKTEELDALFTAKIKGYTVTHKHDSDAIGWHFTFEKADTEPYQLVIADEVLQDWTPKQIVTRLETQNWLLLLGASRKAKVIPRFTNRGWQ